VGCARERRRPSRSGIDRQGPRPLKRIVITGAMGSGKSTLLAELRKRGFTAVPDPARIVLAAQRAAGGDGVPDRNPQRFCDLMLKRMKSDYDEHPDAFYDRGIPDLVGYAHLFGLEPPSVDHHRYDDRVFVFPAWRDIYTTDHERKMTFEMAAAFGEDVRRIYGGLGYEIVDVPKDTPDARARFIIGA
jgi:predicted ATPase